LLLLVVVLEDILLTDPKDNFSAASGLSVHIPTIIGAAGVLGAIMLL
jgi:hypothetical protein